MFYRCKLCTKIICPWDIKENSCPNCGGSKVSPTDLSLWEKVQTLVKNWRRIRKIPGKFEFQFDE